MSAPETLARAAAVLRCPGCRTAALEPAGRGLGCAACGREIPERDGWLDLLETAPSGGLRGQQLFFSRLGGQAYALSRESITGWIANGKTFRAEVTWLELALGLGGSELVLDVPCGQGNFTAALARALPGGVVVGLDLSDAMLGLARDRLRRERVENVVLVRGSALDLPLRDAAVDALSACGGLHLYPDVPQALREKRRVLATGGRVAGLTFRSRTSALGRLVERAGARFTGAQAFDFDVLGEQFRSAGFGEWRWEGKRLIGWFRARAAK